MRVLIATGKKATNFPGLCECIRESAKEGGLEIPQGIYMVPGPGCGNLAMDIIGPEDEAERFVNALTMALMPAKWSTTSDELPEVDTLVE